MPGLPPPRQSPLLVRAGKVRSGATQAQTATEPMARSPPKGCRLLERRDRGVRGPNLSHRSPSPLDLSLSEQFQRPKLLFVAHPRPPLWSITARDRVSSKSSGSRCTFFAFANVSFQLIREPDHFLADLSGKITHPLCNCCRQRPRA
jgi:hypothetical protein